MGAEVFVNFSEGKTAQAAFDAAVERALYDYGHAGYTGTIGEKHEFIMVDPPENVDQMNHADLEEWCYQQIDSAIQQSRDEGTNAKLPPWDDKWGPAACVKVGEEDYYFFGWASS